MALNSSGPISLGGSTSGQSVNLELSKSATAQISMNDAAVRTLTGKSSGAVIMPTDFYGKSNAFQYTGTITQDTLTSGSFTYYGYRAGLGLGSISPSNQYLDPTGGAIYRLYSSGSGTYFLVVSMNGNNLPQNFWSTMTLGGSYSISSSASGMAFSSDSIGAIWQIVDNPAVLTGSGTLSVVFS